MDVRSFVKTTLVQVMGGVADAQREWISSGGKGFINPVWGGLDDLYNHVQVVQFDVAVSVSSNDDREGGGAIRVASMDMKDTEHRLPQSATLSRVAFGIPICPPVHTVNDVRRPIS